MSEKNYIQDLKEIKDIMNRSSRFSSLNGLAGVFAGVFALAGAYLAYLTVDIEFARLGYDRISLPAETISHLLLLAFATVALSTLAFIFFSNREAQRQGRKLWDFQTKRALINFAIPLLTGGILCLTLLFEGYLGMAFPLTIIFYGLALVNTSKYTLGDVRVLGIAEILLGLLAFQFMGAGLLFWATGFGLFNILAGVLLQIRKKS